MGQRRRLFTISAEVTVEVTDAARVQQAALSQIEAAQFVSDADRSSDEVRAEARDEIGEDTAAAPVFS